MNDQVIPSETAEILRLAREALATPGDFVELGCYRGSTSLLLAQLIREHYAAIVKSTNTKSSKCQPTSAGNYATFPQNCQSSPAGNHAISLPLPVDNSQNPVDNLYKKFIQPVDNSEQNSTHPVDNSKITPVNSLNSLCKTFPQPSQLDLPSPQPTTNLNLPSPQPTTNLNRPNPQPSQPDFPGSQPPKSLWLYDSFAGLPAKSPADASSAGQNFQAGALLVSKREVAAKLRHAGFIIASSPHNPPISSIQNQTNPEHQPRIILKKSWFADLTPADLPAAIAFAFLDGDLYDSIKTSLRLVAPLLSRRGLILVHDYNNPRLPGVARAVDEFLRAHPSFTLTLRHSLALLKRRDPS